MQQQDSGSAINSAEAAAVAVSDDNHASATPTHCSPRTQHLEAASETALRGLWRRGSFCELSGAECQEPASNRRASGKRRRQQAEPLNIGDWSTHSYDAAGSKGAGRQGDTQMDVEMAPGLLAGPHIKSETGCSAGIAEPEDEGGTETDVEPKDKAARRVVPVASPSLSALMRRMSRARGPQGRSVGARGKRRWIKGQHSDGSHSSSDEDRDCRIPGMHHPMRLMHERAKESTEVEKAELDVSVDWTAVGGLKVQVEALKECVLHPLLYPSLYKALGVVPPRGVLLHGPPGCGKTLVVRALAGACRAAGLEISFYARKGGDIQSKYVGEAEQRLCSLFEAARRSAPAIIFFDEIDGIAPARSDSGSEGNTHHNAVVTTLLALMDGLVSRGQVVVIGATNRPELLDSALRRPGRFDRELRFAHPSAEERLQILQVLMRQWPQGPSQETVRKLARERSAGLTGADLRGICTEAAIRSIRRTYPQIYDSAKRLAVSPDRIQVLEEDFEAAMVAMTSPGGPALQGAPCNNTESSPARPMSNSLEPLIRESLRSVQLSLSQLFPPWNGLGDMMPTSKVQGPTGLAPSLALLGARALVHTGDEQLLSLLEPSLLWGCDLPQFTVALDLVASSLEGSAPRLRRIVSAALAAAPSVLLVPGFDRWAPHPGQPALDSMGNTPSTLLLRMLQQLPAEAPVLVVGTSCSVPGAEPFGCDAEQNGKANPQRFNTSMATRRRRKLTGGATSTAVAADPRAHAAWQQLLGMFENVVVPLPRLQDAQLFLAGLLHRGLRTLLDWLLEQQNQHSPVPELPPADKDNQDQQPDLTPAEMEREEGEDAYWQRLFRSQVRQVLHAFAQFTRFSIFMQSPEDILKAAQSPGAIHDVPGPLTIREMIARNDAHEYLCVEAVRKDFKQIHQNMQVLFPEENNPAECQVRAHACELLDKAEIKLDCIDKEVVKMLERCRRHREQRKSYVNNQIQALCEQTAASNGDTSASPSATGSGVPQLRQPKEQQRPADLPLPLRDAVEHGVQSLLWELGAGECPPLYEILRLGQRIHRNLYLQHGSNHTGSRQARTLLKELTDAFCHQYKLPESLDGLTAASLLTRRTVSFQKWLAKHKLIPQRTLIQSISSDVVAALIREEQQLVRAPAVSRLRSTKRAANT